MKYPPQMRRVVGLVAALTMATALFAAGCASNNSPYETKVETEAETTEQEQRAAEKQAEQARQAEEGQQGEQGQQPQQAQQPQQGQQRQRPQQGQQGTSAAVPEDAEPPTDEEVEQFASTYEAVIEVQADYRQRIEAAETAQERQQLQTDADTAVQKTIDEGDLPREKFLTIMERMQRDPDLQERISEELDAPM